MSTTKLYKNTGKEKLNVVGLGEIDPGDQISITTDYQPAIILENYPGLVDATSEETPTNETKKAKDSDE